MKEAQSPEEGVGQGPIIRISGGTIEKVMSGTVNLSMDRVDEPSSDIHTQVKEGRSFWELSIPSSIYSELQSNLKKDKLLLRLQNSC